MNWLRRADWLSADRARAYGNLLGGAVLVLGAAALGRILLAGVMEPHGRPIASDFDPFWAGARLALQGDPASAYNRPAIQAVEAAGAQLSGSVFPYLYPPVWMLLCLPLGALPYMVALVAFLAGGYGVLMACMRRILPPRWPLLPMLAFPAAILNAVIGQNGFVSAACFAGAALLLEDRPLLGGACLGMFAYKPQLAICVPVALIAARRWRALASAAAVSAALILASWVFLGDAVWRGFLAALPAIGSVLHDPEVWPKTISVFAAVRHAGGGAGLADAVQAGAGMAAIVAVWRTCVRRPGAQAEMGASVTAAMLCTPYLMDYDLTCLALPLGWLAAQGAEAGWRPWEKIVLAGCYVAPLAARNLNIYAGLPLAPPLLAALLWLILVRGRQDARRLALVAVAA